MKKEKLVSVVIVTKDRKKDLLECLDSYTKSSYKNIEIIVIDNASRPPLLTWLTKKYKNINLVTSDVNLGAAEGRNRGLEVAHGEYIIFTDDDAYAERDMVKNLVYVFQQHAKAGIVQPLVYDKNNKNVLQGAGHDVDLLTGRLRAWGVQEKDLGQYDGVREVPLCGCVWMVKRKVIERIGNYDEDYFIPYEDSDFSMRARKAGFKLYCYSEAKTYHQGIKKTFVDPWIEWLGITSKERAYRVARNKMIFMRKHSPFPSNIFFFFVMLPLYLMVHSLIILASGRVDILINYWLGIFSGIGYVILFPFLGLRSLYKKIDSNLYDFKMFLMAWTDPTPIVLDKSTKTILDLGCGEGKLMEMIRARIDIKKAVGVDLFKPDLLDAQKRGTHEKLILKDIRKVSFPDKSFDVVLCSHVVEHLPKKEALKLIANMERMARKQVVIASPIGEMYHPAVGGNIHQIHLSAFTPEEFERKGYKVLKYGMTWLLGEGGLVHKVQSDVVRKILYAFNILITPLYYIFPFISDYVFVAYKDMQTLERKR